MAKGGNKTNRSPLATVLKCFYIYISVFLVVIALKF